MYWDHNSLVHLCKSNEQYHQLYNQMKNQYFSTNMFLTRNESAPNLQVNIKNSLNNNTQKYHNVYSNKH